MKPKPDTAKPTQESLEKEYNSFPQKPIYKAFKPWMKRIESIERDGNGNPIRRAVEMAHDIESRLKTGTSRIIERINVLSGETISYTDNIPNDFVTTDWKLIRTAYIERSKL
jgi:hypothetical protein